MYTEQALVALLMLVASTFYYCQRKILLLPCMEKKIINLFLEEKLRSTFAILM